MDLDEALELLKEHKPEMVELFAEIVASVAQTNKAVDKLHRETSGSGLNDEQMQNLMSMLKKNKP